MELYFKALIEPAADVIEAFNRWENDEALLPLIHPYKDEAGLKQRSNISRDELIGRLEHQRVYLMYLDEQLIGEMNYMVDPDMLYKKETGTAWIGITIGEPDGRGKGFGFKAIEFLEEQIKRQGLKRIGLGVFEFNKQAISLYKKLGYKEIGYIEDFTFWKGKKWGDIRMEKYLDS
ncbi:GNAT family N-acetyltransferase [Halobacillus salinarum]|uniref:GNAT family N-acetyltransferase n=1 Tax=Halobacillus salinarum TaxID=2932257 RepID=A0ABY4EJ41_9BACI|nr:GNAT family protein [Halobacillus salinarum]UOQ44499.1 GNAT family N-acetyltransferase [Halobacillus salinarum]